MYGGEEDRSERPDLTDRSTDRSAESLRAGVVVGSERQGGSGGPAPVVDGCGAWRGSVGPASPASPASAAVKDGAAAAFESVVA